MDPVTGYRQYIVFDTNIFTAELEEEGGDQAQSVLGIIRARDDFHAQDTASAHFPDRSVFVKDRESAAQVFVNAAEKMGFLNTSEAHHP